MGTDIWVHAEYLNFRRKKYQYINKHFYIIRSYLFFDILAGGRGRREPIYCQRGLPDNVSAKTLKDYRNEGDDIHDVSWLTTQEYRKCLDWYYEIVDAPDEDPPTEARRWREDYLSPDGTPNPEVAATAERIYRYLKASEDKGHPARIVFWFDN